MEGTITKKERDCIIALHDNFSLPVRLFNIAEILDIKAPTAHELVNRLISKKILQKNNGVISLTDYGDKIYSDVITAHRTMEIIFTESGVNSDEACSEIEKIDYLMDKKSIEKLLVNIGSPEKCPHGKPVKP